MRRPGWIREEHEPGTAYPDHHQPTRLAEHWLFFLVVLVLVVLFFRGGGRGWGGTGVLAQSGLAGEIAVCNSSGVFALAVVSAGSKLCVGSRTEIFMFLFLALFCFFILALSARPETCWSRNLQWPPIGRSPLEERCAVP